MLLRTEDGAGYTGGRRTADDGRRQPERMCSDEDAPMQMVPTDFVYIFPHRDRRCMQRRPRLTSGHLLLLLRFFWRLSAGCFYISKLLASLHPSSCLFFLKPGCFLFSVFCFLTTTCLYSILYHTSNCKASFKLLLPYLSTLIHLKRPSFCEFYTQR